MCRAIWSKTIFFLPLLFTTVLVFARSKPDNWVKVGTQHFTVVCDGSEKQAQRLADQFERMRLVFQTAFPNMHVDPSAPIIVIAVKDAKAFRVLEPEAYLAKGQLQLAGLFLRAPEKNYVLVRMDAGGEHPYATVYHEYTHLLLSKAEWIPLWLNEGLAEFFQNTDISDKETILGQASPEDILWLRQNRLLPLTTLLAVDPNSPYYHEEQKGSIFYSEAWALTHYLEITDAQKDTQKIKEYMLQVANHTDSVTAASRVFGDLKQLQSALDRYVAQSRFNAFKLLKPLPIGAVNFKVESIASVQADAVRADFLAYNGREKDARALLDEVLHDDPDNTLAHETMGHLEFRSGHLEEAQRWYEQAVKLDSQSYLANYYFAAIAMNRGQSGSDVDERIESSLQKAIKLNPSFAPSYERLAVFYAMHHKDLDQAHMLMLQAVQLDPGNLQFRINTANILLDMGRHKDAAAVLQNALKLAKTPIEVMTVQNQLDNVQQYVKFHEDQALHLQEKMVDSKSDSVREVDTNAAKDEKPITGPHRTNTGTLRNVHCSYPAALDADFQTAGKTITLHARNYYKIQFSAINYTPKPEFQPCSDLEGVNARVEYVENAATKSNLVVAIELHKQ